MMANFSRTLLLFLVVGLLTGCDGPGPTVPPAKPVEYKTSTDLKSRLEEIAKTGVGGSAAQGMQESIDTTIRPTNAALADDLQKDLTELTRSTDPEEIKTIAARMVGKLP